MKIQKGLNGGLYVAFRDEAEADGWRWIFWTLLRRRRACCEGYFNAYELWTRS